ncbi:MAG TPA: hypothetical protein VM032_03335 [Vicinamibacterales bacterium]|nr:hypothetical protein [Vicinamibacterales bacterium]
MLDRQKVEAILSRRFSGATRHQLAAAANAIMGLPDEWEEILHDDHRAGYHFSNECGNACSLVGHGDQNLEFRLFRRRDG